MKEQIAALVRLQDIDSQANTVRIELERGRERLNALQDDLKELAGQIDIQQQEMQAAQKRQRDLEGEIEDVSSLVTRSRERLTSISTNREYKALLREADDNAKRVSEMEDQLVECMSDVEAKQKALDDLQEQHKAVQTQVEDEEAGVKARQKNADVMLKEYDASRLELVGKVRPEVLSKYKLILKHRDSLAMAAVEDCVCKACHMGIPPQIYNELQVGDKMLYCPHCERILYWRNGQ